MSLSSYLIKPVTLCFFTCLSTQLLTACGGSASNNTTASPNSNNTQTATSSSTTPDTAEPLAEQKQNDCLQGSCFYFSYDDSASTASIELTKYHINNFLPVDPAWGNAFEFLNYENIGYDSVQKAGLFDVSFGLWSSSHTAEGSQRYQLGVRVASPVLQKQDRDNAVITLLIDVSGSMTAPYSNSGYQLDDSNLHSRLDVIKYGLKQLYYSSLKDGDVINLVQFSGGSNNKDVLLSNWSYSANDETMLNEINALSTQGSTNLNAGIKNAYQVANDSYDKNKSNRVIILTDAMANTGEIDPQVISQYTQINDLEGIHFSGIGIGEGFNHSFLNTLTDAGKGSYFAVITPYDMNKAFVDRFISLINVAAKDMQFRLDYSELFQHTASAAEELSTDPTQVQTTNFSYNTAQYFLEEFTTSLHQDEISQSNFILSMTYKDKEGIEYSDSLTLATEELTNKESHHIKDAYLVSYLAKLISQDAHCYEFEEVKQSHYLEHETSLALEYLALIDKFCQYNN